MPHTLALHEALLWIYTLSFFSMGLIIRTRVQALHHSQLVESFRWLAGFGFWHAAADLGELLTHHEILLTEIMAARAACEAISWAFLLNFSLTLLQSWPGPPAPKKRELFGRLLLYFWLLLFIFYGFREQWTEARVLGRYLIGAPATLLTAFALLTPHSDSRSVKMHEHLIILAGWGFLGLFLLIWFGPKAELPLANWLNSDWFQNTTGSPVELWRTIVVVFTTGCLSHSLLWFNQEQQRRMDQLFEEKSGYLDSILRTSLDLAMTAIDRQGEVTFLNQTAEALYAGSKAVNHRPKHLANPAHITPERWQRALSQMQQQGEYAYEEIHHQPDIDQVIASRITPIYNREGELLGYLHAARDITRQRQEEQELREHRYRLDKLVREQTQDLLRAYQMLEERRLVLHQYARIASVSHDHLALMDRDYRYLAVNDAYLVAHSKKREEIEGHTVSELFGDGVFVAIKHKLDRCLSGNTVHYQAWFLFSATGRRYMDVWYHPYQDGDGLVTGLVVAARDVTDWHISQKALQASESRYRHLFEAMENGVLLVHTADGGQTFLCQDVNSACEKLLNQKRDLIQNQTVDHLWPGSSGQEILDMLRATFWDGHPRSLALRPYHNGKQRLWLERYVYRLPSGDVVIIFTDRTAQHQAEQYLEEMARFPNENPNPVLRIRQDGEVLFANQLGNSLLTVWQSEVGKQLHGEELEPIINSLQSAQVGKWYMHMEERQFLLNIVPFPELGYVNLYGQDITEHSRLMQLLQERQQQIELMNHNLEEEIKKEVAASRRKDALLLHQSRHAAMGEMIGHIAHQWRQPLTVLNLMLVNMADMAEQKIWHQEEWLENLSRGQELLHRMSATIDLFRNFLKPGRIKQPFDLRMAVREAVALVQAGLTQQRLSIQLILSPQPALAIGQLNEFSQVVLILLNNARDAIVSHRPSHDGIIAAEVFQEEEVIVLRIRDNGGGIADDLLERIFEPYFTTKTESFGTGIGLYIAKGIIEQQMGGRLLARNWLEGAEFEVRVPAARELIASPTANGT
ncbi:PAS domain-containing protein [Candidatus Magnetaquicoccus inordinatus]|uniref:PAS domain-containing protein n=1 Tax=Candidatus Magnetaquicoccus inordinatus TaxID=2496818 RepID=UPI00102B3260|nr:PAS domain-containing protein [Candidatus Magnetaquicoccus inordinatus]